MLVQKWSKISKKAKNLPKSVKKREKPSRFGRDLQDLYEFFGSFPFISVNPR